MPGSRAAFAIFALVAAARADDLPRLVDRHVDAALAAAKVEPTVPADDATLVRRLTLDLAGRVPTSTEARAYAESADPDKRTQLVERLIASPAFARHLANEFDAALMNGVKGSLRDYLTRAFAENRGWDRVFRDLLVPDESDPAAKGAGEFLKARVKDLDKLTTDASSLLFGVNVSCAQCHDHPLVSDWKQDHYYGMKSFFARTLDAGNFVTEREFGAVKIQSAKGDTRPAKMMFLTGATVDAPGQREPTGDELKREKERLDKLKGAKTPPPPPAFSARAALVDLALKPEQRHYVARAVVNRTWHRLFGRGLVTPLDQMHTENPASHPELLDALANDFIAHGYDLRRLVRGLVLSNAYARSSRRGGDAPDASLFAVARVRPLTPTQLAVSLRVATGDPAMPPADFEKRVEQYEQQARGFAALFDAPGDEPTIGVNEALLFSNGERFAKEFLTDAPDRLVGRLKVVEDRDAMIDAAVRAVLGRPATSLERTTLGEFVERRADPVKQLVWALATSAEFRFNH